MYTLTFFSCLCNNSFLAHFLAQHFSGCYFVMQRNAYKMYVQCMDVGLDLWICFASTKNTNSNRSTNSSFSDKIWSKYIKEIICFIVVSLIHLVSSVFTLQLDKGYHVVQGIQRVSKLSKVGKRYLLVQGIQWVPSGSRCAKGIWWSKVYKGYLVVHGVQWLSIGLLIEDLSQTNTYQPIDKMIVTK